MGIGGIGGTLPEGLGPATKRAAGSVLIVAGGAAMVATMFAKLRLQIAISLLVLAAAPAISAAERSRGLELGVRTGYAFAAGHTGALSGNADTNLSDWMTGQWPIWIDAGFRFNPNFYLGAYFQNGFGFVNDDQKSWCRNASINCSASDTRLGVMGRYHFPASVSLASPWLGYGLGYEWTRFNGDIGSTSSATDYAGSGFEFANLQFGLDYEVVHRFLVAPFISVSFDQYRYLSHSARADNGIPITATRSGSPAKESIHEWILLGVRVAFMP